MLAAPLTDASVADGVVLGVLTLGVLMLGMLVLGVLVTPVAGDDIEGVVLGDVTEGVALDDGAVDGVAGSAMLPFDVVVVVPLVLFFDVSVDCVGLGCVVVCWAAVGTAMAAINTAAIVNRWDMMCFSPASVVRGLRRAHVQSAGIAPHCAHTVHRWCRIVIFPSTNCGR